MQECRNHIVGLERLNKDMRSYTRLWVSVVIISFRNQLASHCSTIFAFPVRCTFQNKELGQSIVENACP